MTAASRHRPSGVDIPVSNALVLDARPGWPSETLGLTHGAHVAVFADYQPDIVGIEGRLAGLELRDTFVAFHAGPRTSVVLLFRKPLAERTIVGQVLAAGTGGLNLGMCRVESDDIITTHSRGQTSAHPVTRDKTIEDSGAPMLAISFYNEHGLHSTVTGAEHLVRGKAAKVEADGLLYASTPAPWGRHRMDEFEQEERMGRWPSNVVLVHGPECTTACEDTCPVKTLDEQSGVLTSNGQTQPYESTANNVFGDLSGCVFEPRQSDSGGASRFYPKFRNDGELRAWVTRLVSPDDAIRQKGAV